MKLGPLLNVGELPKSSKSTTPQQDSSKSSESAQKYTNISSSDTSGGDTFRRESTVASVSNVGFNGSRSTTPQSELRPDSSRPTSVALKKDFEIP